VQNNSSEWIYFDDQLGV